MVDASHICTACGYEGKPVRPPSDHVGEDDSLVMSVFNKLFFALTMLPIKWNFLLRLAKRGKAKNCPNCGLPLMVKLSSDKGWLAKRKLDIKMGLIVIGEDGKARPGDGNPVVPPVIAPPPDPGALPTLDALLTAQEPVVTVKKEEPAAEDPAQKVTKKPVNPEEW